MSGKENRKSIDSRLKRARERLSDVMLRDRESLTQKLEAVGRKHATMRKHATNGSKKGPLYRQLGAIEKKIDSSAALKASRLAGRPRVTFPEQLPITAKSDEVIGAIGENRVVIISGETGSGKSTQIPKMCLQAGRGIAGRIGCTQPRRIAATSIAARIAEELGEPLGRSVGYKIRFKDRTGPDAYIKILTDGMLLAETQGDPRLLEYDTLIIDEAHERGLNIDFLLGIIRNLLKQRPELKLIISSATLDTEKFSKAFDNAPVIEVSGRLYHVGVEYMPLDPRKEESGELTYVDMAVRAVQDLRNRGATGDILVFMPTEQDIRETCDRLEGRRYPGTTILPLYARLPGARQGLVYAVKGPKIVVATNVAETSLTIPGIRYVIDTGLARISRYTPGTRTTSLPVSPISRSSADQRKGRCGRTADGLCIRLYSEEDYESRDLYTPPEILRANLAEVVLRMMALNLGEPASFPFVDPPSPKRIKDGFNLLVELGAVRQKAKAYELTETGRAMARMPLDPRVSRMLIEAEKEGCVREVAVIAAALSVQDPRERPVEKVEEADRVHAPFLDEDSDFITFLHIWKRYHRTWKKLKTQNRMRKFCSQHFLSFPRMREWIYIHDQILDILREQKTALGKAGIREVTPPLYDAIHRAVLSGYLSNIASQREKNIYQAAKNREVMIFPGSTLFNKNASWIVAADMVKTSRLFARTAARIQSRWLEALGGDLCRSTYADPHWEKRRGEVRAFEQVSLFGLVIVKRRPVSFGPIDPKGAHDIFVRSALVGNAVKEDFSFLSHNQSLIHRLAALEDKVRRRGILAEEAVVADFYSRRLAGVYDIRTLKKMIRERGTDDFLMLKEEDLLLSPPDQEELSCYPDHLKIGRVRLKTSYKFDPGGEEDGVTVHIPSAMASGIPSEVLDWTVPGLLREKVTALIKGLPKRYRKRLVPVSGTVDTVMSEMEQGKAPLLTTLARFIYQRFGVDIPARVWAQVEIPDYLRMRMSLIDSKGRELASGRDSTLLDRIDLPVDGRALSTEWEEARTKWERSGMETWDFGTLPEAVPIGPHEIAYPGLAAGDRAVNIRLFGDRRSARISHLKGVERLLSFHLAKDLKFLKRHLSSSGSDMDGAEYFGGADAMEKRLLESLLKRLLRRNIREEKAFHDYADHLRSQLFDQGKILKEKMEGVLKSYKEARVAIHALEGAQASDPEVLKRCRTFREELAALVPEDFLEAYSPERLTHLCRYIKAVRIRSERGSHDPEKDKKKADQVEPFVEARTAMRHGMSPHASPEKMEAVKDFHWMVEEYKVSVFAQELKTPFPVSAKRLRQKMEEIERMI